MLVLQGSGWPSANVGLTGDLVGAFVGRGVSWGLIVTAGTLVTLLPPVRLYKQLQYPLKNVFPST